jgi:uncharacterized protein (TIGR02246 family)
LRNCHELAELLAVVRVLVEAINNHDAAAFGALYTEDAIFLTVFGPVYGLKAIEKWYEDGFKGSQPKNNTATIDPHSVRMLGPDNFTYNVEWSETDEPPNGKPFQLNPSGECWPK